MLIVQILLGLNTILLAYLAFGWWAYSKALLLIAPKLERVIEKLETE